MSRSCRRVLWLVFSFIVSSQHVLAKDAASCDMGELLGCDADLEKSTSGWRFGVGVAAAQNIPHYIGSDETRNFVLPVPYISYQGPKLSIGQGGIVGKLFRSERWFLSLSLSGAIPVNSDSNNARRGMDDLDAVFEYGPSLKYYFLGTDTNPNALFIDLNFREARTLEFDTLDLSSSPSLALRQKFDKPVWGGSLSWVLRYRLEYVSNRYADYFYSVPEQFSTSQRPTYRAKGGSAGYRVTTTWRWRKDHHLLGMFMAYADINQASYVNSPLVKTTHHLYGGLSYFWLF